MFESLCGWLWLALILLTPVLGCLWIGNRHDIGLGASVVLTFYVALLILIVGLIFAAVLPVDFDKGFCIVTVFLISGWLGFMCFAVWCRFRHPSEPDLPIECFQRDEPE